MSPYLNIEEVSEYLRLAVPTVYKKVHLGQIPARKHGGKLVFHKDEIEAWSIAQSKPVKEQPVSKFQQARKKLGL